MNNNPVDLSHGRRRRQRLPDPGPTAQFLFGHAVRGHQCGRLAEAEQLYRKVLTLDARHADSWHLLGVIATQTGRPADAIDLIGRAIRLRGDVPFYHLNLGNALQAAGRLAEAVTYYRRALSLRADFVEAICNLVAVFRKRNRFDDAVAYYQRALVLQPNIAEIHNDLGNALRDLGRLDDAVARYEHALTLRPAYPEAHNNLGNVRKEQQRFDEAVAQYQRALALRPGYAEAHNNLGGTLRDLGRPDEAAAHLQRALALRPGYPEAHNNLGSVLKDLGKPAEAIAHYRQALAQWPEYAEAHNNLGSALIDQGSLGEATAHLQRAAALKPDVAEIHYNLGNAMEVRNDLAGAVVHYERALALRPDYADAHNNLGNIYRDLGRLDDARRAYETAIQLAPRAGRHYRHLFDTRPVVAEDRHFAAAEQLARELPALSITDQTELHFALGKACADLEQPARAFRHFLAGNKLRRHELDYDEPAALGLIERIRAVFTPELMRAMRGLGDPSAAPIFIIGMPRSGTTLIEQILAGHSMIHAVGESEDFPLAIAGLSAPGNTPAFPEIVPDLSGEALRGLAARYLAAVGDAGSGARRIADKLPGNFHFAGLIHLTLPNARILHVRRDPVDTCLSCFTQLFRFGHHYSYELHELGRYYRAYDALMSHWAHTLPAGIMLDVRYEDVVADVEGQARRILTHCELAWDSRCLDFHTVQRPVRTASAVQVRHPVYSTSVGRWRRYGDLLHPLLDALAMTDAAVAER